MDLSFLNNENLYEDFENVFATLDAYRREFEEVYKSNLEENGHKASGNLISSITTRTEMDDSTIEVWLDCAEYYKWIDKGRAAGKWPPKDKILEWIRVKPIIPRPDDKTGKLPTEEQLAFLIARKIGEEGTTGTGDLQATVEAVNAKYMIELQRALEKDWQNYAEKILQCINTIRI